MSIRTCPPTGSCLYHQLHVRRTHRHCFSGLIDHRQQESRNSCLNKIAPFAKLKSSRVRDIRDICALLVPRVRPLSTEGHWSFLTSAYRVALPASTQTITRRITATNAMCAASGAMPGRRVLGESLSRWMINNTTPWLCACRMKISCAGAFSYPRTSKPHPISTTLRKDLMLSQG